ncbi:hypothetical protein [Williamsoniiplasma luminosum]|nr:hypothetical protein [Williamsoniiplasma luminosum]
MIILIITWLSYFKKIKYIAQTAVITALLVALGLTTTWFHFQINGIIFQIADGLFLGLICIIPGPMMLVAGIIYPMLLDLISGGFLFIPVSILVHVLIFVACKLLGKVITGYGAIPVSALLIFIYVLYAYLLGLNTGTGDSAAMTELVVDAVQYGFSVLIGLVIFFALNRKSFKRFIENQMPNPNLAKKPIQDEPAKIEPETPTLKNKDPEKPPTEPTPN